MIDLISIGARAIRGIAGNDDCAQAKLGGRRCKRAQPIRAPSHPQSDKFFQYVRRGAVARVPRKLAGSYRRGEDEADAAGCGLRLVCMGL